MNADFEEGRMEALRCALNWHNIPEDQRREIITKCRQNTEFDHGFKAGLYEASKTIEGKKNQ